MHLEPHWRLEAERFVRAGAPGGSGGSQPPCQFGRLLEFVQLYKLLHSCKSEGAPQVFPASQELGGGGACEGTAAVVELAECDRALGCSNRGDLSISKAKPLESRFCR